MSSVRSQILCQLTANMTCGLEITNPCRLGFVDWHEGVFFGHFSVIDLILLSFQEKLSQFGYNI